MTSGMSVQPPRCPYFASTFAQPFSQSFGSSACQARQSRTISA